MVYMSTSAERMRRLRERRAAEIESSGPAATVEDNLLAPSVRKTLAALELGEQDAAAGRLAFAYAVTIDAADKPAAALRWLGPELLKALEALGATPAARARLPKTEPQRAGVSKLDQLRQRSIRQDRP